VKSSGARVTLKDIAIDTGFSINTVSRALNGKAEVHAATKEKILAAASRLGYRANRLAKGLRSNKTGTIGVIVTDVANPFFSALVKGIAKAARELDYSIILQDSDEKYAGEQEAIHVLLAEQVDGILITPVQSDKETIASLSQARFPFVLVGRYFQDLDTNYVVPDDYRGGLLATEHLLSQGYTRIAMVNGPLHISSARERFQGYADAQARHGIAIDRSLVVTGALTVEEGFDLARSILKHAPPPSAIVTYSDFVAFGVMQAVREVGLSIPEDIAVVGFDDVWMASCLQVPLTTIRSPKEELGRQAMLLLVQKLRNDQTISETDKLKLDVHLVVRESTQKMGGNN
jgi:LacI family transcriptional regulator